MDLAYGVMKGRRLTGGAARAVRRSWEFGSGKKAAAKLAIGLGLGAVAVGASAATAGAGAPVIIAIAGGAFLAGQATNAGFCKLSGRQYRSVQRTNSWIQEHLDTSQSSLQDDLAATNERAHKTIRRAFEHYRRGVRKSDAMRTAVIDAAKGVTCDHAVSAATSTFSAAHHFNKARIYAVPGLFLCQILLDTYMDMLVLYSNSLKGMTTRVGDLLEGRDGGCDSDICFLERDFGQGRHDHSERWQDQVLQKRMNDAADRAETLNSIEDQLMHTATSIMPSPDGNMPAHSRTRLLFQQADRRYHVQRKRVGVRMRHGIRNVFARKTKGERVAVAANTAASVVVSAAGPGLSLNVDLGVALDALCELGFQAAENAVGEGIDRATADGDADQRGIEHADAGTKAGAALQSALQKAAEHMLEIIKVERDLNDSPNASDCESAFERLRKFFKIEHHREKAEPNLTAAIGYLELLSNALTTKQAVLSDAQNGVFVLCREILAKSDHTDCEDACYNPAN
jgi:hypothetical protein